MDPVLLSLVVAVLAAGLGLAGLAVVLWATRRAISLLKRLVMLTLGVAAIASVAAAMAGAVLLLR